MLGRLLHQTQRQKQQQHKQLLQQYLWQHTTAVLPSQLLQVLLCHKTPPLPRGTNLTRCVCHTA